MNDCLNNLNDFVFNLNGEQSSFKNKLDVFPDPIEDKYKNISISNSFFKRTSKKKNFF